MRSRMPFTSRPASRVEYCLASVTASSITARGVQERVAAALGTMCEVTVTGVDVSIEELA